MKKILLSAMFILSTFVYAEVPKSLKGNWSLNKEASIKELESLDEKEKPLAMMRLNVMSDIKYVVDDKYIP